MPGPDDDRRATFLDDLDLLPDTTSDERSEGWGDSDEDSTARLISDRPRTGADRRPSDTGSDPPRVPSGAGIRQSTGTGPGHVPGASPLWPTRITFCDSGVHAIPLHRRRLVRLRLRRGP